MVAVVNGYVCFTTCDAKKARQGQDPLALSGASSGQNGNDKSGLNGQPATILGGTLKAFALDPLKRGNPGNANSAQPQPGDSASSPRVDMTA